MIVARGRSAGTTTRRSAKDARRTAAGCDETYSREGLLRLPTNLGEAVRGADAIFIAVGTPSRRGDRHADLSYVYAATRDIAAHLGDFSVVITKSTVPVGTGDEVERI